jgi:hypothetical protein
MTLSRIEPLTNKRPLRGRLLKRIDLTEAKARGLRAAFALPPDENDIRAHHTDELEARLLELNEFYALDPADRDYCERLAKALGEDEFGIPRDDQYWWARLAWYLIRKRFPGFSIKQPGKKKRGTPRRWTDEPLMQLFADVEFLKRKKTGSSVVAICKVLTTKKGYKDRWGHWSGGQGGALRRAYVKASKRFREDGLFRLELCGGEALMREKRVDLIEEAIKRHALRL